LPTINQLYEQIRFLKSVIKDKNKKIEELEKQVEYYRNWIVGNINRVYMDKRPQLEGWTPRKKKVYELILTMIKVDGKAPTADEVEKAYISLDPTKDIPRDSIKRVVRKLRQEGHLESWKDPITNKVVFSPPELSKRVKELNPQKTLF